MASSQQTVFPNTSEWISIYENTQFPIWIEEIHKIFKLVYPVLFNQIQYILIEKFKHFFKSVFLKPFQVKNHLTHLKTLMDHLTWNYLLQ